MPHGEKNSVQKAEICLEKNGNKEGMTMKMIDATLTKNPCYTAGRKIKVGGLMLHSIGCPQPKAAVLVNSWNDASHNSSCVHAFIDADDGTVYQTLPWDHRGWHCGKGSNGSGNNTHIGVEMCEPACIKYTGGSSFTCSDLAAAKAAAERTYRAAAELFAMLCKEYGLDPLADGVVISHKEGHRRGIASNHGDPEHLWGQLGMGYTMDTFRAAVKAKMGGTAPGKPSPAPGTQKEVLYRVRKAWGDSASQKGAFAEKKNAVACADANPGYSVYDESGNMVYTVGGSMAPYQIRVTTPNLNIRTGPGTDYAKTGKHTGAGVFTIVEERAGEGSKRGWGLLKSYAGNKNGWVSLDYAKRI